MDLGVMHLEAKRTARLVRESMREGKETLKKVKGKEGKEPGKEAEKVWLGR